jgi:hypothetical protein
MAPPPRRPRPDPSVLKDTQKGNAWFHKKRFHKKWSGPLRRVELDPEPPVKSGRPAPAFRLSRSGPKSAAGHAHGPSDSGTRRFSIGSKDRRVQHLRCRPTPNFILANPLLGREPAGRIVSMHAGKWKPAWAFQMSGTARRVSLIVKREFYPAGAQVRLTTLARGFQWIGNRPLHRCWPLCSRPAQPRRNPAKDAPSHWRSDAALCSPPTW